MIGILLFILKLLGIILLCILGLLLLIIFAVLFVPVRYSAMVRVTEDKKVTANVCVHWLLRLLQARVSYRESAASVTMQVAGIRLGGKKGKKKKQKKKRRKGRRTASEAEPENDAGSELPVTGSDRPAAEAASESDRLLLEEVSAENASKDPPECEAESTNGAETDGEAEPDKKAKPTLSGIWQRLKDKFFGFFSSLRNLYLKAQDKKQWLSGILAEWQKEPMQQSVSLFKRRLFRLLLHILPQKGTANLQIGFDDPSVTGKVLGVLAMLYPRFGGNLNVVPYFDRSILAGEISCRGRIRILNLLILVIKTWRDKNIRSFIGKLRNGGM